MNWDQNPFAYMGLINIGSGSFSALAGLYRALVDRTPLSHGESSPWLYVLGGCITVLIGVGNWYQLSIATWGTVVFILTSIADGWFGPGRKDFRFYTLTAYVLVQSTLVVWSILIQSPLSLP